MPGSTKVLQDSLLVTLIKLAPSKWGIFAQRKGRCYDSILCDLEHRHVLEVSAGSKRQDVIRLLERLSVLRLDAHPCILLILVRNNGCVEVKCCCTFPCPAHA